MILMITAVAAVFSTVLLLIVAWSVFGYRVFVSREPGNHHSLPVQLLLVFLAGPLIWAVAVFATIYTNITPWNHND